MTSQAASSSSSSVTSSSVKFKKRKWTREQLLKSLEILGSLSAPLPPELPPSPPCSRPDSPVPSFTKRKHAPSQDHELVKRPRITSSSEWSSQPHHSQYHHYQQPQPPLLPPLHRSSNQPPNYSLRSEPSEDGELREDPVSLTTRPSALPVLPTAVPVRRPRRGKMSLAAFEELYDKYHKYGRMLKYSGDARFWSTYPPTHKEYRPLNDPPPPNSPYHKYGGLIARLELADALVCFTYALWCREYVRRTCHRDTWGTIEAFLGWCKFKWQSEDVLGDREKALLGLILMIEGFIRSRTLYYTAKASVDPELELTWTKMKSEMAAFSREAEKTEMGSASTTGQHVSSTQKTPPMLPSPASIAPDSSASSTPIASSSGGTPSTKNSLATPQTLSSARVSQTNSPAALPLPAQLLKHVGNRSDGHGPTPAMVAAAAKATVSLGPTMVYQLKEQSGAIISASCCMDHAQRYLTLPIMARHYPITFARMMGSSLAAHEEHEPDIEDEEGELLWPTQSVTGEGLGWVCLMGKAMVKELGRDIGYVGLDGVVRKPEVAPAGASPLPSDSSRQVSAQR